MIRHDFAPSRALGALIVLLALGWAAAAWAPPAAAAVDDMTHQDFLTAIKAPWTGDLDGMIERRAIRALVVYSKTNYFLDGLKERGLTYEAMQQFEKYLNKQLRKAGKKKKHLKVHVVLFPVSRDKLIPYLMEGKGDIAAAMLTVTPARQKLVAFSNPFSKNVHELVVTGPGAPKITKLDDLAGKQVFVRLSSSYAEHLKQLNRKFKKKGLAPIKIEEADENLETEDILEMVNAGLIPITVADDHLAHFWAKIFKKIKVHQKLSIDRGGAIAWALRKKSPQLLKMLNRFVKSHKQGTLMGNMLINRYLQNTKWVRNMMEPEEIKRFKKTIKYFRKYADQYGFDWLMITALAYQESRLNQKLKSPAGAVGVMQILPSTAASKPVEIKQITILDRNIHAGVKYLRFVYDRYFKNDKQVDQLNKVLFTFAAYNAGPARVEQLRQRTKKMGLDPNIWFRNVEQAAARVIGRETVQYVANIYKYYIAYRQIIKQRDERKKLLKKK
ncbi:MAG: lytic transglycosylase F [Desulfarculaceae bacterium]|nr:lytic transglycosylase F [Desulfarculaceae bacterium]MCF8074165.1 lytic transglycosylase F [Desulfarculaceae bacterium]MCF8102746.1 lytic transglycosylase F [Desulfarculaceae bacterium]MCF8116399.1 lytic transglycosylase F [Desulfarculaceae bacterium]